MKTFLGVLGLIVIGIIYLFVVCACILCNWSDRNGR